MKLYDGEYKITSWFGPRTLSNGDKRTHKGIDCVGLTSKNVIAICDATVASSQQITNKANSTWEWGNYIRLDDGHGYSLFYCHLDKRLVVKGDKLKSGQVIGVEGQTGYSFGSHLHFEVRNAQGISIDPQDYFAILERREGKILTVQEAKEIVKAKAALSDSTIVFLENYKWGDDLFVKLAKAMIK